MHLITYTPITPEDHSAFLAMAQKLWKDMDNHEVTRLLEQTSTSKQYIILARTNDSLPIGFAIFTIRAEYVEGASQSPTGYLEGIFVEEGFRRKDIARTLVGLGEDWCKSQGCVQMGSDTWVTDKRSRAFHEAIGFNEEDILVHFIKDI
jgi:aminoglycoside 6'-N-acetyltransferase I